VPNILYLKNIKTGMTNSIGTILLILFLVGTTACMSKKPIDTNLPDLIPYRDGDKWGYCTPDKKIVIAPKYTSANFFVRDTAEVSIQKDEDSAELFGLINKKGEVILPIHYKEINRLSSNLFYVRFTYTIDEPDIPGNREMGIINSKGIIITPPKYTNIYRLSNELYIGEVAKGYGTVFSYLINSVGKELPNSKYVRIDSFKGGYAKVMIERAIKTKAASKFGYIDYTGKEIINPRYDNLGKIYNGCTWFMQKDINKYGVVNIKGEVILKPTYDYISEFKDGIAIVIAYSETGHKKGKYGLIDSTGKNIVKVSLDTVCPFNEGLAKIKRNGKYGFIDKAGKEIIPPSYLKVEDFQNNFAVFQLNNKKGLINKNGITIIPAKYDEVEIVLKGLILLKLNGKIGFADQSGNIINTLKYDAFFGFANSYEYSKEFASVKFNDKYGFIDKKGNEIIPPQFQDAKDFDTNGYAIVKSNNLWGVINSQGQALIPIKYVTISHLNNRFFRFSYSERGKEGMVNISGKEIIPPEYDGIGSYDEGLLTVINNKKAGYTDSNGKLILPIKYEPMSAFENGLAKVTKNYLPFEKNTKIGMIDKKGN
jgi:hypothetical protein